MAKSSGDSRQKVSWHVHDSWCYFHAGANIPDQGSGLISLEYPHTPMKRQIYSKLPYHFLVFILRASNGLHTLGLLE